MESAAALLCLLKLGFVSGMGVVFGWQPMSDGSERYEYIVQIEPELAATLQEGHSIPITSDIPQEIGPIGRIRVIVGREELPRQRLVTQFKPWPQQTTKEGLVETQYTVPPVQSNGSGRYGNTTAAQNQNNQILPPGNNQGRATNPFTQSTQQGAQNAQNLTNAATQPILPPTKNQLFGNSGQASQNVQNAIDNTTENLRRNFQQGVEQVADRTGQQLLQAVENMGRDAKESINQFTRSNLPNQPEVNSNSPASPNSILPPRGQINKNANGVASNRRIDQPIQAPPRYETAGNLNSANPATGNRSGQLNKYNDTWSNSSNNASQSNSNLTSQPSRPSRYENQTKQPAGQWPRNENRRDDFNLASRPPNEITANNSAPRYPNRKQTNLASTAGNGPSFPNDGAQQYADSEWANSTTAPEIRRDMLKKPIENDAQFAGNTANPQAPRAGEQPYKQPASNTPSGNFGWPQNSGDATGNSFGQSKDNNTLYMLLSWVLLSGSAFGNVYLFWSYLDVRNKYQGMVYNTSGRRDRYED